MVIFVLRHADRSSNMDDDLSAAGVRRAECLGSMLRESGATIAYCSDALRTRQTLASLKQALGKALTIKEVSAAEPGGPAAHVQAIVSDMKTLPDSTVAIAVSHSNTVGLIIEGLHGGSIAPIAENEFDKLFILVGPVDAPKALVRLRY